MILYNLVNPSDPITFKAASFEAALLATGLLSTAYAATPVPEDAGERVPMFLFSGSFDQWFANRYPGTTAFRLLDEHRADVADALDSLVVGDRDEYEAALAAAVDPVGFREAWNLSHTTSVNDIAQVASSLGRSLRRELVA